MIKNKNKINQLLKADGSNFAEYQSTLKALREYLRRVKEMTERYPVYLLLSGQGYRFESPDDVDAFLHSLEAEVQRYMAGSSISALPIKNSEPRPAHS